MSPTFQKPSSIDNLTNDEVLELISSRLKESQLRYEDGNLCQLWRLTHDTVLKVAGSATEAFMMRHVSAHTSIPIPTVRRILPFSKEDALKTYHTYGWIVMDYIPGMTLHSAWAGMSWWRKLSTLWTFRRYMDQLRQVPLLNLAGAPGPFDAAGYTYKCQGFFFTEDGAGPFQTYTEMADWFDQLRYSVFVRSYHIATRNGRLFPANHKRYIPAFDKSHPLVFCHMDIHVRNLIVGDDGKLWLIDWARAGAFPRWLEFAEAYKWEVNLDRPSWLWTTSLRWTIGDYWWYYWYLDKMILGLTQSLKRHPPGYLEERGVYIEGGFMRPRVAGCARQAYGRLSVKEASLKGTSE